MCRNRSNQGTGGAAFHAQHSLLVAPFTVEELSPKERHAEDSKRDEEEQRNDGDAPDVEKGEDQSLDHNLQPWKARYEAQRPQRAQEAERLDPRDVHRLARRHVQNREYGDGAVEPVPAVREVRLAWFASPTEGGW